MSESEKLNKKIEQLKLDYENEWWRATKIDNYDLKTKLLRVGCRPLQRKLLKCKKNMETSEDYKKCADLRLELDECYSTLQMLYYITKREEILK